MISVILDVHHFLMVHWATNLGLILDNANLILKAKIRVSLLQVAFQESRHMDIDTLVFVNIGDALAEIAWSKLISL